MINLKKKQLLILWKYILQIFDNKEKTNENVITPQKAK